MVINRDKHNQYFTIVSSDRSQNTAQSSQSSQSTDNSNTTNTRPANTTTVIYTGGGMSENQTNKLNSIEEGAEVNQNAFSFVTIKDNSLEESNTISAESKTDTLTIQAITPITIEVVDNTLCISCSVIQYLKDLLDVDITNLADKSMLQYNLTTQKWEVISDIDSRIASLEQKVEELEQKLNEYELTN